MMGSGEFKVKRLLQKSMRKLSGRSRISVRQLFMSDYYCSIYPDLALSKDKAEAHYEAIGWKEGRNPNPLFNVSWYLAKNPDVAAAGIDPALHFLGQGWQEGRDPSVYFSGSWYLTRQPDIAKSGRCPLEHYLNEGWKEGRVGVSWFDLSWYRASLPSDVAIDGDPLSHYIVHGWKKGGSPNPLFDTGYYLRQNSDVAEAGLEPFGHYLLTGSHEGRMPHPLFDSSAYQQRNPDVSSSGVEPLLHYLSMGKKEQRIATLLFDSERYLSLYDDVRADEIDPLIHYLRSGWKENRSPNDWFNVEFYYAQTPRLSPEDTGPALSHFVEFGWRQGRSPSPNFDLQGFAAALEQGHNTFEYMVEQFLVVRPVPRGELGRPSNKSANISPYQNDAAQGRSSSARFGAVGSAAPQPDMFGGSVASRSEKPSSGEKLNSSTVYPHDLLQIPEHHLAAVKCIETVFDCDWYLHTNRDLDISASDAILHYLSDGWKEGRNPHPLFSTSWYQTTYPDVAEAELEPLQHYIEAGWKEGRDPSVYLSSSWYAEKYKASHTGEICPLVDLNSGAWKAGAVPGPWFDPDWYERQLRALGQYCDDPLKHYMTVGWQKGLMPNPLFSSTYYLLTNVDVAETGLEPVGHYLASGSEEGRKPHPLFDPVIYRNRYGDEPASVLEPLTDYLDGAWKQGRHATSLFDATRYLAMNPDVAQAKRDPLRHYLTLGWKEGRAPNNWFDASYYLAQPPALNVEVISDPLSHFADIGWRSGRKPCSGFDIDGLLTALAHGQKRFEEVVTDLVDTQARAAEQLRVFAQVEAPRTQMSQGQPSAQILFQFNAKPSEDVEAGTISQQSERLAVGDVAQTIAQTEDELNSGLETKMLPQVERYFHAGWYQSQAGLGTLTLPELIKHYMAVGFKDGKNPHPLFDVAFYLRTYPDVAAEGTDPFDHFLNGGWKEGRCPIAGFDAAYYTQITPEAANHNVGAWGHYVSDGWKLGLSPNVLFDAKWYSQWMEADLKETGDLFAHYLHQGWMEGLAPHPCFDPSWYRRQLVGEGLSEADIVHYERIGFKEGISPSPMFDEAWYKKTYLADHDLPGLPHYLVHGWGFKLHPHPLFDSHFYAAAHPDLTEPALQHYVRTGENSGARPNEMFSPVQYVAMHRSNIPMGMSPFAHFVADGDRSHFSPSIDFRSRRYWSRFLSYSDHNAPLWHYMFFGRHYNLQVPAADRVLQKDPLKWLKSQDAAQPTPNRLGANGQVPKIVVGQVGVTMRPRERAFEAYIQSIKPVPKTKSSPGKPAIAFIKGETVQDVIELAKKWNRTASNDAVLVLVDHHVMMSQADIENLVASLVRSTQVELAFPLVLNRHFDVAYSGSEIVDQLAWPRAVGGDPDHPTLRPDKHGVLADGPVVALRINTAVRLAADIAGALRVADWAIEASKCILQKEEKTLFVAKSRAITWNVEVKSAQKLSGNLPKVQRTKQLLFIDSLITMPDRDAGSYYALSLMRMYQSWGYEVTFCPDADYNPEAKYVEALEDEGIVVLRWPFVSSTAAFIEHTSVVFDVVLMSRVHSGGAHLERARSKWPAAALIFHPGDLHYLREQREAIMNDDALGFASAIETRKRELFLIGQVDATILVSDYEVNVLRELHLADHAFMIAPEYHSTLAKKVPYNARDRNVVCFVGGYRHLPNVDAAEFLVKEVWPHVIATRANMKLELVGSDPPEEFKSFNSKSVKVVGFVPDIGTYFENVRLSVAPVRYGAGIKLKMIASLEAGVPVVSTSVAAEGIGIDLGDGYVVADEAKEIAEQIIRLFDDPKLLNVMSAKGMEAVNKRYSAESVHAHYRRVLDQVLEAKQSAQTSWVNLEPAKVKVSRAVKAGVPKKTVRKMQEPLEPPAQPVLTIEAPREVLQKEPKLVDVARVARARKPSRGVVKAKVAEVVKV
jgi:glycosyltransferase involved in cell wall biosynthesis